MANEGYDKDADSRNTPGSLNPEQLNDAEQAGSRDPFERGQDDDGGLFKTTINIQY